MADTIHCATAPMTRHRPTNRDFFPLSLSRGRPPLQSAMGKADKGRNFTPPAQDLRKNVGRFNAKVGKKELKETEAQAIAKKQEPFDVRPIFLYISIFGAACGLLFMYLQWVLEDDISDEELLAAAKSSAKGS